MSRGVISFVEQHPEWKTYSFQLSGDRTYYRAGKFFKFNVGDSVEFDTEVVGRNTKASKVRSWVGGEAVQAPSVAAVTASAGPKTQQDYWGAREARDLEVQKRIEWQASRNSAIELVKLLVTAGVEAVKLPAKQADKARVVEELVSHYTNVFVEETRGKKASSVAVIDNSVETKNSTKEAAEEAVEKKENNDDANWN